MRTEIKQLHQRTGTTIVYVTHDQIEAMTLGDCIAVMKDGVVQQFGSPREIYDNPSNQFVAGFIGSPSMNFIPATVTRTESGPGLALGGEAGDFILPASGQNGALETWIDKQIVLGIRPEQITQTGAGLSPGQSHSANCRIDILEPTGPDTLVFTRLNDTKVVCRVHPGAARGVGEDMPLAFDMSKAVFFDPATENRIA